MSLSDEEYGLLARRYTGFLQRLNQRGGRPPDWESLQAALNLVELALRGDFPRPRFRNDRLIEEMCELLNEGPPHPEGLTVSQLALVAPFEEGKTNYSGEELVERAVSLNSRFGQHTAEYLEEHAQEIPEEWFPEGEYIVFPETTWRVQSGKVAMPFVRQIREQFWEKGDAFPELGFTPKVRLLVARS